MKNSYNYQPKHYSLEYFEFYFNIIVFWLGNHKESVFMLNLPSIDVIQVLSTNILKN